MRSLAPEAVHLHGRLHEEDRKVRQSHYFKCNLSVCKMQMKERVFICIGRTQILTSRADSHAPALLQQQALCVHPLGSLGAGHSSLVPPHMMLGVA